MLRVVRSPLPGLCWQPEALPEELTAISRRLMEEPRRCLWLVPSSRRRRALLRQAVGGGDRAVLLPRLHTLESFVAEALEYSPRASGRVPPAERLLRLARAWTDVTGKAPQAQLVRQLDRFVRDWQACCLDPSGTPDTFARVVQRYLADLTADQRLDRMSSLALLIAELAVADSWPRRFFFRTVDTVVFDGFHRLEPIELDLIGTLSKQHDVLLWLVAMLGQLSCKTAQAAVDHLQRSGHAPQWQDVVPPAAGPIADLGRRLFPIDRQIGSQAAGASPPVPACGIFKLEQPAPLEEVEAVARSIKRDHLAARDGSAPLRLSDVAVIIPGPGYDPLIREVFPRAGLEFNLAGRALEVSQSRPARVLTAAVDLIRNHWRYDSLFDFINLPVVRRRLHDGRFLDSLFRHRPRLRKRLDHAGWRRAWQTGIDGLRQQIGRWSTGQDELPDRHRGNKEEYLDRKRRQADGMARLVADIDIVLQAVTAIEHVLANPPARGAREFVKRIGDLFRLLSMEKWLETGLNPAISYQPVPWVEYEKDQQAYFKLQNALQALAAVPDVRLPLRADGRPDLLFALMLALDSESYQIKTEDDAGVQIFELRETRGMRFRHIYVLGLVDGVMPVLPEEGMLVVRRRQVKALCAQLEAKEDETKHLFAQVFESAAEKLVLSRWTREGDLPATPSPFLVRVGRLGSLTPESPGLVPSVAEAAARLGRRCTHVATPPDNVDALWPTASAAVRPALTRMCRAVAGWRERSAERLAVRIASPELLATMYALDRPFSPSELEQYAACPFRYFGARVLRLAERESDESWMAHGSLLHRVLNRFYQERRRAAGEGQPLPATGNSDRSLLLQLYREAWSEQDEGLVSPELRTIFERGNGLLDFFLQLMACIEADAGNLFTELALRVQLGPDAAGRPVFLEGVVDRVDGLNHGARTAGIIDYKTGAIVPGDELAEKLGDGRRLQLPLYAAGFEMVEPGWKVARAAYVHLAARKTTREGTLNDAIVNIGPLQTGHAGNNGDLDTQAAVSLALDFAGRIRAGVFPLTSFPRGSKLRECDSRCPLRHACRHPEGYEHSRWR